MSKKILALLLCLALLPCLSQAENSHPFFDQVHAISQEIIELQLENASCGSVEAWIEQELPLQIGGSAEGYVLALAQSGAWDFSAYSRSLRNYLDQTTVRSASTRLKFALSFLAAGVNDPYISSALNDSVGKQGIVSWVYGLHLMNNGCTSALASAEETINKILSMQLKDGGWAITGTVSDTDVTALVVQALAPYYTRYENIQMAVDRALLRLSELQRENGGFATFGTPNPESASQVLIALSALGIDALTDERFIKAGHTILDGITAYRLPDGSYCHIAESPSSAMATVQVFSAMISYQRLLEGKGNFMVLDNPPDETNEESDLPSSVIGYKPIVSFVLAGLFLVFCSMLFLLKKRHWKNFLAVFLSFGLLISAVWLVDIQSADVYYHQKLPVKENSIGQITLSIRCDTAAQRAKADFIPQNGEILADTSMALAPGDTPFALLTEAARAYGIHVESSGAPGMRYIVGINYLYEFALSDLSGWIYFVNGASPSVSCDQYQLHDGDRVEWLYSCELGNDLK